MISVSFNLRKDDVLALACHYYATSPTVRSSRITTQMTISLVLASVGLFILSEGDGIRPLGIGLLVCAGVSAVFFPSWYRSSVRETAEKMITESSYQRAFGGYTLSLSEEGLASTSPVGESKYAWEAIDRVSLTPGYLFIFLVGPQGFPIPRAQVSDSTIQEVRAFAESHIRHTEPKGSTKGVGSENRPENRPL